MPTAIECTKDEFKAALLAEFGPLWESLPQRDNAEFVEVVDGLVKQANNTRGTLRGHNAYLDLDFEVGGIRADEITIPAVTDAQRDESLRAAHATIAMVRDEFSTRVLWTAAALEVEIHKLMAALGHLTIAEGENCRAETRWP